MIAPNKINETKVKLVIKRIFEYGDTWQDVENFFCTNQNSLKKEVKEYLLLKPDSEKRYALLEERAEKNVIAKKEKAIAMER